MSSQPEATAVATGTELLERAIAYTRSTLALVTPDRLWRPTPCADWDLAGLLVHMDDSLGALLDAVVDLRVDVRFDLGPSLVAGLPGDSDVSVVRSLRDRACRLLGHWSRLCAGGADPWVSVGGRALPASVVAVAGALEITVHGWDVAQACGQGLPLPESLAAELLAQAPALVTSADRKGRFGPALACPANASAGTRLLAFTGRAAGGAR